ncbi:lipoprotein-anchoring transpeptidase ErfK/SrfK [Streptomyces sp. B3I7]|uniref:L,D-transpeptidase n=1 Tax=Streptomyces sp. B3I7 TaxID=3042269 RepID=UPI002783242E|nr:Ig-like domain-containing protein [Streptomyces sp. B3I7]MDQ0813879.1 lipoprotein-anchoring transpeptidase ErfK/SrfK [Streptomyces sp. B3I7]
MSTSPRSRTVVGCSLLVVSVAAGLASCSGGDHPLAAKPYDAGDRIAVSALTGDGGKADPDKPLEVTSRDSDGRLTDVTVTDAAGRHVPGELTADGSRWRSTAPLASGAHYTVRVSTEDEDGAPGRKVVEFDTGAGKAKKVDVTFGPDAGTYGVGQPVTATLSEPVEGKAARAVVERSLHVSAQPAVEGSWYWVDDTTLHYRPKDYWPAHATVEVSSDLRGLKVAERLRGGEAEPLKLTTGDKVVAATDAATHTMTVYRNDEEINEIPVTTGKSGFETRNGVKVVLGKQYLVRMRSTSIGIAEGSTDSYDLPVYYATQLTLSGEYVHAAPWSVDSQGSANVSHGCTGMSTSNAEWFYDTVRAGDVVTVVNSEGDAMAAFGNGFGDWNLSWKDWQKGSALAPAKPAKLPSILDRARLRPQGA